MTTNLKSDKNHTFILQSFKGMYTSSEILIDLSSEFPGESQQFTSVRSFRSSFSFKDEVECVSFKQVEKRGSQITKWCVTTRRHVIEIPPPTNISSQSSNPIIFLTRHNTQKLPLSMFLQHFRTFNGCSMPIHTMLQVQFLSNNIFLDVYKIQPKYPPLSMYRKQYEH